MTTTIFYFSGTGNSLHVARTLAEQLHEATVIAVPKALQMQGDCAVPCVGLVFPVYMFGLPTIMAKFIKQLQAPTDAYVFAIATYNGMIGQTLRQTEQLLQLRGLKLAAGIGINMPGNATMAYDAWPVPKQEQAFAAAYERIGQFAQQISARQNVGIEKHAFWQDWLYARVYRLIVTKLRTDDKAFWVDNRCHSCGLCQRVCPVNNIIMHADQPTWQHHCEQCLACFHWCPQTAIQIKKITTGRTRYHHPQVKVSDFLRA
jgi:ferredoxin